MSEERNIYLYWIGKEYKLIRVLRELIYLHSKNGKGYKIHFINDKNITDYVSELPSYFYSMCPAHQADYIRVNVICDRGGIWLDSDTLVLGSLDELFDLLEGGNGFFIRENKTWLWNGIFGSKANTHLMQKWREDMRSKLDETAGKIGWTDIGNSMLQNFYSETAELYSNYKLFEGLDTLYPVNWDKCVLEYLEKPYENYKSIVREFQPLIALVNSVYKNLEHYEISDILNGDRPINYFLDKSIYNYNINIGDHSKEGLPILSNYKVKKNPNRELFEHIYRNQIWNNKDTNVPLSGPGSSIMESASFSECLTNFINEKSISSITDLGCGDLTWVSETVFFKNNTVKYTGVDIVRSLIESHSEKYPAKSFKCLDLIVSNEIEKSELFILRDVIFHLTNREIQSIFENIKGKFDYIAITSCNNDINTDNFDYWHFSQKNINIPPFNKKDNYEKIVYEPHFNRKIYIYGHDNFYS